MSIRLEAGPVRSWCGDRHSRCKRRRQSGRVGASSADAEADSADAGGITRHRVGGLRERRVHAPKVALVIRLKVRVHAEGAVRVNRPAWPIAVTTEPVSATAQAPRDTVAVPLCMQDGVEGPRVGLKLRGRESRWR